MLYTFWRWLSTVRTDRTSLAAISRLEAPAAARSRRQLAVSLARLCASAHAQGIDHDDLHVDGLFLGSFHVR